MAAFQDSAGRRAMVDNILEGFENLVQEPVLAHQLAEVFDRVQLRRL